MKIRNKSCFYTYYNEMLVSLHPLQQWLSTLFTAFFLGTFDMLCSFPLHFSRASHPQ